MITLRKILYIISVLYAIATVYFISVNNIAGLLLLFYLVLVVAFTIFVRTPFSFLKIIVITIPIFGLFFPNTVAKVLLLIMPFVLLIYFKQIKNGLRIINEKKDPIYYGMCFMLLGALLSLSNAFVRGALNIPMVVQTVLLVYALFLILLIMSEVNDENNIIELINTIKVPALFLVAMVVLYAIFFNIGNIIYSSKSKSLHLGQYEVNANLIAMILMPIAVLLIPMIIKKKDNNNFKSILFFMISVSSIILTSSRGAWLGFMSALFYILIRLKKIKYLIYFTSVIVLIGIVFSTTLINRFAQTNKHDVSLLERFVIWQAAIRYIVSSPMVGLGPDAFKFEKYKLGVPITVGPFNSYSAHNIFLEIAANYGGLFLVGFILLMGYCFITIDNRYKSFDKTNDNANYLLSVNAAIIAILVHSFFDCNLADVSFATILSIFIGITLSLAKNPSLFCVNNENS